ncbi:MAG: N-acetylmuramoyl-L-alanine amidase [Eubacterium sp.]|nr:N-acetylmuramoyl-L-alanine amidase [Eubacterium sp.]
MSRSRRISGKKWCGMVVAVVLIVLGGWLYNRYDKGLMTLNITKESSKKTIVIDAGHGGADPGKVGVNGTLEKDINLAIAKKLQKKMTECGYTVYMTRESDESLTKEGVKSRKMQDLIARVEKIEEWNPSLVISIHQNSYPKPEIKGAQVFYHKECEEGKQLAGILQDMLTQGLDGTNKRVPKGDVSYYLLKEGKQPIVIVECGFLSNPEEEALLKQEEYQNKIVSSVAEGVENFLYKW